MTPEEREMLYRTVELAEENNKILRKMRRSALISNVLTLLYWFIIISAAFGAYYFIQPYLDVIIKSYNGMSDSLNSVKSITEGLPSWFSKN